MQPYEIHNAKLREDRQLGRMGISTGTWANQQGLYEFKRNNPTPVYKPEPWRASQSYHQPSTPSWTTSQQSLESGSDSKSEGDSGWGGVIALIVIGLMIL